MRSRESLEIEAALAMPKFREILQTPPKPDEQIVKEMGAGQAGCQPTERTEGPTRNT